LARSEQRHWRIPPFSDKLLAVVLVMRNAAGASGPCAPVNDAPTAVVHAVRAAMARVVRAASDMSDHSTAYGVGSIIEYL
jgi:hypothetical protein